MIKTFYVSPPEMLYVGDTVFDLQAAREAGVLQIGITTGYHSRERLEKESPDYIIESLSDLKELVI